MAPIRTAIIGLSASAATSWARGAHLPYLLSPRGRAKYEIVALCNSSVEAAQRAVKTFDLPPQTRTYGDPADLASDPGVDLVVVCTRVDTHHAVALPSVRAGKDVYVEWPLAHDVAHARELVDAARAAKGRTVVGVQGRVAPVLLKVRDLIREGRIGKVLSSEFRAAGGSNDRVILPTSLQYFTDRAIGGNVYTIGFGHLFDQVQHVLGELQDVYAQLQIQRPEVKLRDLSTESIVGTTTSSVPDLIVATGTIAPSDHVARGALLLGRFRRGQPFHGEPALVWTINGEAGEIRLTSEASTTLHAIAYSKPVVLELHDFASDTVGTVEWKWEDWQEELPMVAKSVGKLYELFAEGDEDDIPTFDSALRRTEQLNEMLSALE